MLNKNAQIVQFTHPGIEHGPDQKGKDLKSWNTGGHRRKFMRAKGNYVASNGKLITGKEQLFWGEWEPPSKVAALPESPDALQPRWLHIPYLPAEIPSQAKSSGSCSPPSLKSHNSCTPSCGSDGQGLQNTDPFVFGACFKYFVCKQWSHKTGRSTGLATLEKGSVILFGSTIGKTSRDAFFQLDTVFVIGGYVEYSPSNPASLPNHPLISSDYRKASFHMAFPSKKSDIPPDLKLRLYFGATFSDPYNGMYSFAPARVAGKTAEGFPRVPLRNLPYLTNNLNSAPKYTKTNPSEMLTIWKEIRETSRKHGCVEGVQFDYENP